MIILNFHGLGKKPREMPGGEWNCWLDTDFFTAILDAARGRKDVQLTFDDANESDFTIALPLLRERGLKAKFFLVAGRLDTPHFLSSRQVKSLCEEGMTVANHGMRHVPWKNLGADGLREELLDAKKKIESITAAPVSEAACPFGSYGRKSLSALRQYGYQKVYTSDGGAAHPHNWIQSRNTVTRPDTLADVQRMMDCPPAGFAGIWGAFKKAAKRWR